MDRHNPKPAAARFQHGGKQCPRPGDVIRSELFIERFQLSGKLGVFDLHPMCEPFVHPLRHFGSACLGKCQAQDRLGLHAAQQQPQHARRQDVGLARPRRCGQPHMVLRVRSIALFRLQRRVRRELPIFHGHTIPPGASDGHSPNKVHIRGEAWP